MANEKKIEELKMARGMTVNKSKQTSVQNSEESKNAQHE